MPDRLSRAAADRGETSRLGPLPAVVTSPKVSAAYQAHSYPTKIPPEAVVPFIEASTSPGGVVLDPFCGSGMTGVAAQLCGRSAILSDLSPGAVHLARNHNDVPCADDLLRELDAIDGRWMARAERSLYGTSCPTCGGRAITRHIIWSDVHACRACGTEVVLWHEADPATGSVPRRLPCPACPATITRSGQVPVRVEAAHRAVSCRAGCAHLQRGPVPAAEARRLAALARRKVAHWFPAASVGATREMYKRSALHLRQIQTVEDFYLPRARHALARLWHEIGAVSASDVREALRFAFTNTAWHASRMRRYNARGGQRPLTGTLYIPQLTAEANVFEVFRHQVAQIASFSRQFVKEGDPLIDVRQSSAAELSWLGEDSVDYVFTDPPFGSNIFYADCNLVWEAWLGEITDVTDEIVVNRSRTRQEGGKTVKDYRSLLAASFGEVRRVLRPGGRASIVFHNSDDKIWSALLSAAEDAGLHQTDVSIIDKVQRSMKGYRGRSGNELVPFYDLVVTFRHGHARRPALNGVGEIAVDVVRRHLTDADRRTLAATARERSLEFLYSVAVSEVVALGGRPEGLSYRTFEALCRRSFTRSGQHFFL